MMLLVTLILSLTVSFSFPVDSCQIYSALFLAAIINLEKSHIKPILTNSLSLYLCLSLSLSLCLCLSLSPTLSLFLSLSLSRSISLSLSLSLSLYLFLSLSISLPPSFLLSICVSLFLSLSLCPSLRLAVSISLSVSLSVCLSLSSSLSLSYSLLFCKQYRMLQNNLPWPAWTVALAPDYTLFMPVTVRSASAYQNSVPPLTPSAAQTTTGFISYFIIILSPRLNSIFYEYNLIFSTALQITLLLWSTPQYLVFWLFAPWFLFPSHLNYFFSDRFGQSYDLPPLLSSPPASYKFHSFTSHRPPHPIPHSSLLICYYNSLFPIFKA